MNKIKELLSEVLGRFAEKKKASCTSREIASLLVLERPPRIELGDLAVPMFPFAKYFKTSPSHIASELIEIIELPAEFTRMELQGGYINFFFERKSYTQHILQHITEQGALFGAPEKKIEEKVVIEFSSPNSNKPLHLGHLRNNILGESMSRILSLTGREVIKLNLVNDRGIHICKSMLAYQKFGEGQSPEDVNQKGDHFVGDYYVRFLKWAEEDAKAEEQAQRMLQAWEKEDSKVRELWAALRDWTIQGHAQTYARTGVSFHAIDYESDTYLRGKKIVGEGERQGIFSRGTHNEIVADLTSVGLDEKVLLRSDGTALYVTQDLGTAVLRSERWHFDRMIYVVASEQDYHFNVLFELLKNLGYTWASRLQHLSYGMVHLPEGKLKSREGRTVDADTLLNSLTEMAQKEIQQRGGNEEKDAAASIAVAALHYYLLRPQAASDILFDPDASLEFQGNTGPYIQYMVARIYSLERKSTLQAHEYSVEEILGDSEWLLLRQLGEFSHCLLQAAENLNPAILVEYLYRLARNFSQYYHVYPIIDQQESARSMSRLMLALCVRQVLENGMYLLNIPILKVM